MGEEGGEWAVGGGGRQSIQVGGGEGEVLLLLLQTAQSHLHVCVPRTFFVFFRFKNVFRGPLTACVCDARP